MKNWIIVICILIIVGIIFFITKSEKDNQALGGNYYYLPPYEAYDVGFMEGAIIYKSAQKNVFSDIKIHGEVIDVNYNEDFIIAVQQIDDNSDNKDIKLSYFIIVKKSDVVFGPFNKEEYMKKREELLVPKELNLKE